HKIDPKRTAVLAERAHAMRQAPTESEAAVWRHLAARTLGLQFRRQMPIGGGYIADSLAPAAHVIAALRDPKEPVAEHEERGGMRPSRRQRTTNLKIAPLVK